MTGATSTSPKLDLLLSYGHIQIQREKSPLQKVSGERVNFVE